MIFSARGTQAKYVREKASPADWYASRTDRIKTGTLRAGSLQITVRSVERVIVSAYYTTLVGAKLRRAGWVFSEFFRLYIENEPSV